MAKESYDHKNIDEKWQARWREDNTYRTESDAGKEKAYVLDMFPYPSGEGLHVGHPKGYIATDVYSRHQRMQGKSVLHPMGWDAFGLPAENYALKNKVHPRLAVEKNIATFKEQLQKIGFDYDWSREINTTDPEYYHWTQWIFLKLYEHGLAFRSEEPINWCPSCMTGLANEDLDQGRCERCDTPVVKKQLPQWVLKITDYADRLLADLEHLPKWPEHIKESQRNWIGRSEGVELDFTISFKKNPADNDWRDADGKPAHFTIFTTRPDTLFGVTYVVIAPEHPWLMQALRESHDVLENGSEIRNYLDATAAKSEIERTAEGKEKTGVKLEGISVVNPINGEEIPVYVADYVLGNYGTGAVMAVPGHDERDFAFATKFGLEVKQVIAPPFKQTVEPGIFRENEPVFVNDGIICIIKHWSEDTYLALKWKKVAWGTLLTGVVDEGLSAEETVTKEIREETGYLNPKIVRKLGAVDGLFYHVPKQVNKHVHGHIFYVELENADREGIADEENEKHDIVWLTSEELKDFLTPDTHKYALDVFTHGYQPYLGEGSLMDSGAFTGRESNEAMADLAALAGGRSVTNYRLRDWVFSRQRYWGEPIPMLYCDACGVVPVPYENLPVRLPEVEHYEPTGTGESPLAAITDWVNTTCPNCKGPAKRETNTMPQWAGSSWYYLRFMDPHNDNALVSPEDEKYWSPVDVYVGGAEHATRHLIYARFWHKFLYDIKVATTIEPFTELHSVGLVIAEDGRKMSKRFGNVINPDDVVERFGADAFRVYEMFMGPFENTIAWNTSSLVGARRFLDRIYTFRNKIVPEEIAELSRSLHKTIQKVSDDIPAFRFNTAISAMMILLNDMEAAGKMGNDQWKAFLRLLAPFAPHLCEELWQLAGGTGSIHLATWPEANPALLVEDTVVIGVQVAGKRRGEITISPSASEEEAVQAALLDPGVAKALGGAKPGQIVYREGRILNLIP
ncbi:MAG: class I tRNA ligase family protein [Patescibacteria group bacterium]